MKQIRTSKFSKLIAYYLAIMMFLQVTQPVRMYALTSGPTQPEFNAFTPIGTSDMVDLASGDFNYNIPIMDVGGYPINLAYNSGVSMDQEASWVGLGWNLNIGQINRDVRGLPDDFKGDLMTYENNMRDNLTVGSSFYINPQIIGSLDNIPISLGGGLNMQFNNYKGYSAVPSYGLSFRLSDQVSVGMQLSSSNESGATLTPNVSLSYFSKETGDLSNSFGFSLSPSISYNSREGLSSFNINSGITYKNDFGKKDKSIGGSISFLNNTFTPSKRVGLKNNGATFSYSGGVDIWGFI
ncbi:hypothetical protein DI487_10145 [Flavobacterium sediminis]|uniref:Uncharacterized protein n=1 Tax=Flavobacterium sediminis TaxID=2201181 RepID=A0A2U8QVE0_9FLAO|nr:hypothetical protein [Flavobacterium sediminis]AWM14172.1 hypothetical protein DI487_10145 [Flavobacterium sediminis]